FSVKSGTCTLLPRDAVVRLPSRVREIYRLYGASTNLRLLITEGPHKHTQDLQLPVFRWFYLFLKSDDPIIETAAKKYFVPEQLKVLLKIPDDQKNTTIQETFVPKAGSRRLPTSSDEWAGQRDESSAAWRAE